MIQLDPTGTWFDCRSLVNLFKPDVLVAAIVSSRPERFAKRCVFADILLHATLPLIQGDYKQGCYVYSPTLGPTGSWQCCLKVYPSGTMKQLEYVR